MAKTKEEKRKGAWERNMLFLRQYMQDYRQEKSKQILEKTLVGIKQSGSQITLESGWLTNKSFVNEFSGFFGSFDVITVNADMDVFEFTRSGKGYKYYQIEYRSAKSGRTALFFAHLFELDALIQVLNEYQPNWKPKQ